MDRSMEIDFLEEFVWMTDQMCRDLGVRSVCCLEKVKRMC